MFLVVIPTGHIPTWLTSPAARPLFDQPLTGLQPNVPRTITVLVDPDEVEAEAEAEVGASVFKLLLLDFLAFLWTAGLGGFG